MSEQDQGSTELSRTGCVVALALVFLPGLLAFFSDHLSGEDWPFALFCGVLLALPFGYLALDGTRAWLPWGVVVTITACFWGALIASAIISVRDQTGANIGMGLVMLASPLVVTACAWVAVQVAKRS